MEYKESCIIPLGALSLSVEKSRYVSKCCLP
jgi:hypothetical protein